MMYHLKRSFAGGPNCSGPGFPVLPPSISSAIIPLPALLRATQRVQQVLDSVADDSVHDVKISRKGKYRDNHHRGGRLHFFPGGRDDLAHLAAHVLEKIQGSGERTGYPVAATTF